VADEDDYGGRRGESPESAVDCGETKGQEEAKAGNSEPWLQLKTREPGTSENCWALVHDKSSQKSRLDT
jgi:hypothetical protein